MNSTTGTNTDTVQLDVAQVEAYQEKCNTYLSKISSLYLDIKKKYQRLLSEQGILGEYVEPIQNAINTVQKRATLAENKKQTLMSKINSDVMTICLASMAQTQAISAQVSELQAALNTANNEINNLKQGATTNNNANTTTNTVEVSNGMGGTQTIEVPAGATVTSGPDGSTIITEANGDTATYNTNGGVVYETSNTVNVN